MRKFKFRAWRHDGEYSHMIESEIGVYTAIKHCLGIATSAGFSDIDNQPKKDGYTLMQWTGLKDRNGKEIYEGDIVKAKDPYKLNSKERFYTCEVVFTDGALFMLKHKTVKWGKEEVHYYNMRIMEIEVIGNIFENPELLEVGECKD